jgi:hypothetical protein
MHTYVLRYEYLSSCHTHFSLFFRRVRAVTESIIYYVGTSLINLLNTFPRKKKERKKRDKKKKPAFS